MPNANDFLPGDFLNAAAIPAGVRIQAKVTKVVPHKFDDGLKLVVYTDATKGVPLNKTRGLVMINAFGLDYNSWVGQEIVVYRGETRYGGQRVPSVEIEAVGATAITVERRSAITGRLAGAGNGQPPASPPIDRVPDGPDDEPDGPDDDHIPF